MVKLVFTFLLLTLTQTSETAKLRHINVITEHSSRIVHEYVLDIITAGRPVKNADIDCIISELKGTGLFNDVEIKLKPTRNGEWVDMFITPSWDKRRESFVIDEIVLEGFKDIDGEKLTQSLSQKGFSVGTLLLKYSLKDIGKMLEESAREIYASNEAMLDRLENMRFNRPWFDIKVSESERVRLTISLQPKKRCS